ncbi:MULTISPECIES: ABC transporter permease [Rhodopseudomonas]|uniref:ABC transporter permease n=1 Tax=Rhodopseudomonas palustris TaxID=1076 RepID=A0A0D7E8F4_RHOPL|nr:MULTISPECIES: ABC transporter permease [Rhodopseudomonas]KIZ37053.1 ABC transporter permease [Rhodopseudomonas palustris]MDF3810644.1 ABC transporter permease [Rhodopseudomonas sp. BAL398]WOK16530.1 ABC transporter permease [Rhodopseudomonas sp. BAL398]
MRRIVLRRLAQIIPLILGVIVLNFALIHLAPGSLFDVMTSEQQVTDPAMLDQLRHTYGVDQPVTVQLFKYIWSVMHLDLGYSYRQNAPVLDVIMQQLPATVILMLAAMAIALLVGLTAGVVASVKVNTIWDNLISLGAVFFFAAPSFWIGIMMTVLFSVKLGWFPVGGMRKIGTDYGALRDALDVMYHLVLPATALGLFYAATYARVMRASMLEVFRLDFVRTARAKGLSGGRVILAHVMRNALLPIVTLLGLQLGTMLGGSVVIEAVFSWPGIGSLLFDSVMSRNYPMVLGVLVLGSLLVAVSNATVDLVYLRLDPRIRAR